VFGISREEGDRSRARAIESLHRRYAGAIFDLCLRMLGDRQEAEDAVQETFVNAFRSIATFRYGESHLPWLYKIGTNVCLKVIRARRRAPAAPAESLERVGSPRWDPADAIHARRVIERLADELDDRSLAILSQHYVAGMDQGQIAASLGISRRAVVKRLTAVRERARALLEGGGGDG